MLICENVSAGYGGGEVLHNVSFALPDGENLAVLGPNGAGKTTLLKCIAGLLPFRGQIKAAGLSVAGISREQAAKKIAILSQFSYAVYPYTVWEVVMMGRYVHLKGHLLRTPGPADVEAVHAALAAADLRDIAQKPVTELSGGQLQRVFLAQVLAQQPSLILLDEPTSHLDLKIQAGMMEHLRLWAAQPKRAIVGVLHDINLALQLAGYVLLLRDGAVVAFGPAGQVVRPDLLRQTYGMDVASYMVASLARWEEIAREK